MRRSKSTRLLILFVFMAICFVISCGTVKQGYDEEVSFSHEAELKTALSQIREVISEYKVDHGHPPSALSDIIDAGYINNLPEDPFTGKKDWVPVWSDCPPATANCKKSIIDVHSASTGKARDGTFYKDW